MGNLTYANGECSVEGNISSLNIRYEGNIMITSKLPSGYTIKDKSNILSIDYFLQPVKLSYLFNYLGKFKIINVSAKDDNDQIVSIAVRNPTEYSENITISSENMTKKSEEMKADYFYGRYFTKTRVLPKVYEGLHTESTVKTLMLDDEEYSGSYHLHIDGSIMTGVTHTKESKTLVVK